MKRAFLFTGQGTQFVGMGADLAERFPAARAVFDEANEILGEDLAGMCWRGPEKDLALTQNTQPATLAMSMAAYRALDLVPDLAAGHSLGEYTALTAAGSFRFGDAIRLVQERARRMQAAVPVGTGGMVALLKMNADDASAIVSQVDRGVCEIANLNAPGQIVLSGELTAMDQVVELVGPRQARKLAVSVPFHCSLLRDAAAGFAEVLDDVEMRDPAFPIYCNVDACPVTTATEARDALRRQFAGSVLWQASIESMLRDEGVRSFVECGPKAVLSRMVGQIATHLGIDGVTTMAATNAEQVGSLGA